MIGSTSSGGTGPQVFKEHQGATLQKGDNARLSSFIGAIAVADLVKTTLGPKGMDKMLVSTSPNSDDVTVTNDGATILKKVPVDNPAAKVLVNISMTQDDEVGDGTTSVVVLAGELLREAEKLTMQKLHPQTIIRGWRKAIKVSIQALNDISEDNKNNQEKFKEDLLNIARTTLCSKIVTGDLDFFAKLCVDAVLRLKGSTDLDMLQIVKKPGGSMNDSFLDDGFILNKKFGLGQKTTWENPVIMVANTPMDTDKIKIWGARVRVSTMTEVANIEQAEKLKMKLKCENIMKHNINIFINRQLIYDYPEQIFRRNGISSIEHADFEGVERLARVLGCEIMSVFDTPQDKKKSNEKSNNENTQNDNNNDNNDKEQSPEIVEMGSGDENENEEKELDNNNNNNNNKPTTLGTCKKVEEIMIGEDTVIKFSGVAKGEACSIVLRGASKHLLDEMERSIHDALCVLTQTVRNSRIVYGGGSSEMHVASVVDELANQTQGKEQLAIMAFANALRQIPIILADNAGFDSAEVVSQLRSVHKKNQYTMGVNMKTGKIGDMKKLGVVECLKSKSQSLISAHEAAEMILRVDDIVKNAPRSRGPPR